MAFTGTSNDGWRDTTQSAGVGILLGCLGEASEVEEGTYHGHIQLDVLRQLTA